LYEIVKEAIREGGWEILQTTEEGDRSLRLQVVPDSDTEGIILRIYIWNLTHGGGAQRPLDEYRIQITGVTSLKFESGVQTLLLG